MDSSAFIEDLRRYFLLIIQWVWLLIVTMVLAGGGAYLISLRSTPVYRAATRLLVNQAPATRNTDYSSLLTSERLAQTYAELLATNPVLDGAIEKLGLAITAEKLRPAVQVHVVRDTQLIDLQVEDTDPERAALLANTIVEIFIQLNRDLQTERYKQSKDSLGDQLQEVDNQIQEVTQALTAQGNGALSNLERDKLDAELAQLRQAYASLLQSYEQLRLSEASATSNVVPVEPASTPTNPVRPRPVTNSLIAAFVSLALALAVILINDALDDTLNPDDVARQIGIPILGAIAHHDAQPGRVVVTSQPRSPVSEAFRALRTNIQFASVDQQLKTILVTSPSPEDGKSTVAANLGGSLSQSGSDVMIVEADLRRPKVHKQLGLANRFGMSTLFVQQQINLDGMVQDTGIAHLSAITSGELPPNPSELLGSEKMIQILAHASKAADIVIVDSPPVMAVTDASVLATRVDGVLLVVKPGVTKLAACKQSVEQLQRMGAKLLGVVLNDIPVNRSRYKYAYYKGYYYTYDHYYSSDSDTIPLKG